MNDLIGKRFRQPMFTLAAALILGAVVACASAEDTGEPHDHGAHDHGHEAHGGDAAPASQPSEELQFTGDAYPLSFCVVTGDPLDAMGAPVSIVHEGRHVQFCCDSCKTEFAKDPSKWLKKIDEEIVEQQAELYPLDKCMVSGEKLGEMGAPVDIVAGNRLVRLRCGGCEKAVRANPAKYIEQLDAAAIEAQRAGYPSENCVVSGEKLGSHGEIQEIVHAGRLVRLCCESCVTTFRDHPSMFLGKLDEATGASGDAAGSETTGDASHDHGSHEHHDH